MIKRFSVQLVLQTESNKESATVTVAAESGPLAQPIEFDALALSVATVVESKVQAMLPDASKIKAAADKHAEQVKELQDKITELTVARALPVSTVHEVESPKVDEKPRSRRSRE